MDDDIENAVSDLAEAIADNTVVTIEPDPNVRQLELDLANIQAEKEIEIAQIQSNTAIAVAETMEIDDKWLSNAVDELRTNQIELREALREMAETISALAAVALTTAPSIQTPSEPMTAEPTMPEPTTPQSIPQSVAEGPPEAKTPERVKKRRFL